MGKDNLKEKHVHSRLAKDVMIDVVTQDHKNASQHRELNQH